MNEPSGEGPVGQGRATRHATFWPVGKRVVPHEQLTQLLATASIRHARRAIAGFVSDGDDDILQAAVSAGTAVELLAKACVVATEPTLLAAKGHRDSLLVLAGRGNLTETRPTDIRTITASEVIDLVRHLHRSFVLAKPSELHLLAVRNAASHMGLVDHDELVEAVGIMVGALEGLARALSLDRLVFWGPNAVTVADSLLQEANTRIVVAAAAKVAAAKDRLAATLASMTPILGALYLQTFGSPPPDAEHAAPHKCPACEQRGWIACVVVRSDVQFDRDDDGDFSVFVERTAWPTEFGCTICGLSLDAEEMLQFDFPESIVLEPDFEPREIADEWEPDEDLFRDR